ncbi:MAG TPA: DinB family protein [Gemmatimonadaceae bacterium]|nr:DinB family protein [Gemmatimonadaceae bacterium]
MNALLLTALLAALALPGVAAAQADPASPVADALRSAEQRAQRNLVASAQEMPADKYSYKPTSKQMSFGQLVLHIAGSNAYMCSTITGQTAPAHAKLAPTAGKDKLVAQLKASFDYCHSALATVDDSQLAESVPFFGGRKITRAGAMMGLAEDWSDHYAAAAIYLRLNGHLPPTAQHRGKAEM